MAISFKIKPVSEGDKVPTAAAVPTTAAEALAAAHANMATNTLPGADKAAVAPAAAPQLGPSDEGFQAQVAQTFGMDTVEMNGVSVLVPKPDEPAKEQGLFEALNEFAGGKIGALMLIHKTEGHSLQVIGYEPTTKRIYLKNSNGLKVSPLIGDREAALYKPHWR